MRRRKEVILHKDLYDGGQRRSGRLRGKKKKPKLSKTEVTTPRAIKMRVKIPEVVTVSGLARKISVKAAEVIQQLLAENTAASALNAESGKQLKEAVYHFAKVIEKCDK